ncbi:MAG TPA: hypothetical protein VEF72_05145 [Mycobacterium sp.]|nr:hypothetical protein [Mycobacterium sp.]
MKVGGHARLFISTFRIQQTCGAGAQILAHGFGRIGQHGDLTQTGAPNRSIVVALSDCGYVMLHAVDWPREHAVQQPHVPRDR